LLLHLVPFIVPGSQDEFEQPASFVLPEQPRFEQLEAFVLPGQGFVPPAVAIVAIRSILSSSLSDRMTRPKSSSDKPSASIILFIALLPQSPPISFEVQACPFVDPTHAPEAFVQLELLMLPAQFALFVQ
jgi:hypothetical protein